MTSYSKEQEVIVEKVLSSKGDYYKILSVEKTSNDVEIKKAYRKLALKIHPDKNSHPNSPEAFKAASKAFEVLSDATKKRIYDQTGQDPDLRGAAAASSGFSGFSGFANSDRARARGPGPEFRFANDINDDIFNIFFGGGPAGQAFTFGPGGSGIHFQSFGGGPQFAYRRQARQGARQSNAANAANDDLLANFTQFLPIIIVVLFSIILSVFGDNDNTPNFSFSKKGPYKYERTTPKFDVTYYVHKDKVSTVKDFKDLDRKVENKYVQDLNFKCSLEKNEKEQILRDAYGFFYNDENKIKQGLNYPTPACDKLKAHGLI